MYAVIRAGGKQYRVAPGDVIRVEKAKQPSASGSAITFNDVLAVSATDGQITRPSGEARVTGRVVEEGRADKVLVFHYKRKKQYKKLAGHRQPFTAVRITEIAFDGQHFKAADEPEKQARPAKAQKAAPALKAEHKAKSAAHHAAAEHKKARTKAKHKTAAKSSPKKRK